MAYSLIGELFHEIDGITLFILFIIHHWLNRKWIMNLCDILPPPSLMLRGGGFSVKNTIVSR